MAKRTAVHIGSRDLELFTALDALTLTPSQLTRFSQTFESPFPDASTVRRRLRRLVRAGMVRAFPYALAGRGQSPVYYKLTQDGYRLLYGPTVTLPGRRYFGEISLGQHRHSFALAEFLVHLISSAHHQGMHARHIARENSLRIDAEPFTLYPDGAVQLVTPDGRAFNFVVELDNGSERVRSRQDIESIERKVRGYDAHQRHLTAFDPDRYVVLFVTTRSRLRLHHILEAASQLVTTRQRTLILGTTLSEFLACSAPLSVPVFQNLAGRPQCLIRTDKLKTDHSPASISNQQAMW